MNSRHALLTAALGFALLDRAVGASPQCDMMLC
jgi:hypothetical protein